MSSCSSRNIELPRFDKSSRISIVILVFPRDDLLKLARARQLAVGLRILTQGHGWNARNSSSTPSLAPAVVRTRGIARGWFFIGYSSKTLLSHAAAPPRCTLAHPQSHFLQYNLFTSALPVHQEGGKCAGTQPRRTNSSTYHTPGPRRSARQKAPTSHPPASGRKKCFPPSSPPHIRRTGGCCFRMPTANQHGSAASVSFSRFAACLQLRPRAPRSSRLAPGA